MRFNSQICAELKWLNIGLAVGRSYKIQWNLGCTSNSGLKNLDVELRGTYKWKWSSVWRHVKYSGRAYANWTHTRVGLTTETYNWGYTVLKTWSRSRETGGRELRRLLSHLPVRTALPLSLSVLSFPVNYAQHFAGSQWVEVIKKIMEKTRRNGNGTHCTVTQGLPKAGEIRRQAFSCCRFQRRWGKHFTRLTAFQQGIFSRILKSMPDWGFRPRDRHLLLNLFPMILDGLKRIKVIFFDSFTTALSYFSRKFGP